MFISLFFKKQCSIKIHTNSFNWMLKIHLWLATLAPSIVVIFKRQCRAYLEKNEKKKNTLFENFLHWSVRSFSRKEGVDYSLAWFKFRLYVFVFHAAITCGVATVVTTAVAACCYAAVQSSRWILFFFFHIVPF